MDNQKIGKFIAKTRKEKNLTQEQLAEKLGITYKAVSKWETGKNLPDASIMIKLCEILNITVNELLSGEHLYKEKQLTKLDENLIKITKQKEIAISSARITHMFTIIILLIWNILNVIFYGVEDTISKPEFLIMNITGIIYFSIYIYLLKKNNL